MAKSSNSSASRIDSATTARAFPAVTAIYGDEEFRKSEALQQSLKALIPPDADREMVLSEYDGTKLGDEGGTAISAVFDDLNTLPFLADRRVVVIRDADKFITAYREPLERYTERPSPTGYLVLVSRSFPKTTRLAKAMIAAGWPVIECKKLNTRELAGFVVEETRARGKRIAPQLAQHLVDLIGQDQGCVRNEVEKLVIYLGKRPEITQEDIALLVGQSREEKVFAVMDAVAAGQPRRALELWHQVLESDPAGQFKAVGGVAYVLRRWLAAHVMTAAGESAFAIAPKVGMWNRGQELEQLLRRMPALRVKRLLARVAELDAQAKVGARSIETGIESVLLEASAAGR